ncbi:MAG: hypothetical protein ACRECT_01750 [Thermoplasmata archaeon]
MVDLQETPAVAPMDTGGDERAGYFLAGGTMIFLGWGLGVLVNLALHYLAPSGGLRVAGIWFGPVVGTYAWAAFGFGLMTGAIGIGLLFVGQATPKGRLVLPGTDY